MTPLPGSLLRQIRLYLGFAVLSLGSTVLFDFSAQAEEKCTPMSSNLIKQSLTCTYYQATPKPELSGFSGSRFKSFAPHEQMFLNTVFKRKNLRALAARDTDRDGIVDYRVMCNGKFVENDTDVDGDGVLNVLDDRPYRHGSRTVDEDNDRIPDHVDLGDKPGAEIQEDLFRDYGVLLIDRCAGLDQQTADMIDDAVRLLFRPGDNLKALRVIALEAASSREISDRILAEVVAPTGTMIVYNGVGDAALELRFGTLIHELMHVYQFSLDQQCDFPWTPSCSDQDFEDMKKYNIYRNPEFYRTTLPGSGWNKLRLKTQPRFSHLAPHDCEIHYEMQYTPLPGKDGKTEEWWNNNGYEDYKALIKPLHVLGSYSLTDLFEWQAEHMSAYVFLKMEDYALHKAKLSKHLIDGCLEPKLQLGNFYHRHAATNVVGWFEQHFPISERWQKVLYDKYMLKICPQLVSE